MFSYLIIWLSFCLASCLCLPTFQSTPFYRIDDMMFKNQSKTQQSSYFSDSSNLYPQLWPGGVVFYEISHELLYYKHLITKAMHQITHQIPCITFRQRIYEDNYIYIDNLETGECLSYVGMIGGRQELFLGYNCRKLGIIMHELMHALGFYHEHSRPDRDDYLCIFYENIKIGKEFNFDKVSSYEYRTVTEFDYNSIMIYGQTAFSWNSLPTMLPWDYHYKISNPDTKDRLSLSDVRALSIYYECQ